MKQRNIFLYYLIISVLSSLTLSNLSFCQTWKELLDLADSLYYKGKIDTAVTLGERSLDVVKSEYGEADTNVALAYQKTGKFLFSFGKGDLAEDYWHRAINITLPIIGKENLLYTKTLGYIALRHYSTMKFQSADSFFTEAIFLMEKVVGTYHLDFARLLNNYGVFLISLERYSEAERIFQKSLKIRRAIYKSDNIDICESLGNLAIVYKYLGNLKDADSLTIKSQEIFLNEAKSGNPQAANKGIMDILARQRWEKGDYITADSLFQSSLQFIGRSASLEGGDNSIDVRIEYARMLIEMALYDRAESVLVEATDRNRKYNRANKHSILLLNSLANINLLAGRNMVAESLYFKALSLTEEIFGSEVPLAAEINNYISQVYRKLGDNTKALAYAERSVNIQLKNIFTFLPAMSEYRALLYIKSVRGMLDNYFSCYHDIKNPTNHDKEIAFSFILKSKGLVTEEIAGKREFDLVSNDGETKILIDSIINLKRYLSALYARGPDCEGSAPYKRKVDSLNNLARIIESNLALISSEYRGDMQHNEITRESIFSTLPRGVSLVEYFIYDYVDSEKQKTVKRYLAAVLNKSGRFNIYDLGPAYKVDDVIKKYRQHFQKISELNRPLSSLEEKEYNDISSALYRMLWEPLTEYLNNSSIVFIAPDGEINFISFAGLSDRKGEYLVSQFPVQYISAGRDFTRYGKSTKYSEGLLAVGDPDYDAPAAQRLSTDKQLVLNPVVETNPYRKRNIRSSCVSIHKIHATALPSSRQEIENVTENFRKAFPGESSTLLLGSGASEEHFKSEVTKHRFIHIASHGYFIDGSCNGEKSGMSSTDYAGENPLLLSGLLLAGANLHGTDADEISADDGILTALEVSSMDLRGIDLVVLSACETALGELEKGEGLYGLRRAFHIAGARTVVSSLWQIPDAETKSFMEDLYSRDAKTYPELMRDAALRRINELKLRGKPTHPYTWGSFIATGDWKIR